MEGDRRFEKNSFKKNFKYGFVFCYGDWNTQRL
jgi:hypothetical protein